MLKSNVENNDNARASNMAQNCEILERLIADYGPSVELHITYITQLYIHITVQHYLP